MVQSSSWFHTACSPRMCVCVCLGQLINIPQLHQDSCTQLAESRDELPPPCNTTVLPRRAQRRCSGRHAAATASATSVPAAHTVTGACCPSGVLASLSAIYPDFYKRWPPTPQCAFNLGVQFENLFKLVCQGGTADCLLYRTHVGRCDTTCAESKPQTARDRVC